MDRDEVGDPGRADGYQARVKAFKWLAETKKLIVSQLVRPKGKPRKQQCWGPVFGAADVESAEIEAEQVADGL